MHHPADEKLTTLAIKIETMCVLHSTAPLTTVVRFYIYTIENVQQ